MQTLVLCDDYWHPARVPREGLGALKDSGFSFDWIENAADWSAEQMANYPLIILTKSNNISSADQNGWMTEAIQAAFVEYVRKGNGLLAIHSGMAGWGEMPVLRGLLGGVFDHHPRAVPGDGRAAGRARPHRRLRGVHAARMSIISWPWTMPRRMCS